MPYKQLLAPDNTGTIQYAFIYNAFLLSNQIDPIINCSQRTLHQKGEEEEVEGEKINMKNNEV